MHIAPSRISRFRNLILGKSYALSVAFVSPKKIRALNKQYRGIDAPTDVLSFPYSKTEGEIYFCASEVTRHARVWQQPVQKYLPYLLMHGMIHLLGVDHGSRMTALENKYAKLLAVTRPQTLNAQQRGLRRN